ncbi:hypothetical protein E2562_038668 [Oryza meyeriana var. granulata]|uniref:Uncharacterized protein n=1 Tax=Oryza meyeriana var. granulata TaxID=110450 RepID=A0A6G1F296_9ORYZ|nr:hypothetical protein E2562_038668 [Oryza meyeriana var. granulata]
MWRKIINLDGSCATIHDSIECRANAVILIEQHIELTRRTHYEATELYPEATDLAPTSLLAS